MAEVELDTPMKNVAFKIQSLLAQRRQSGIQLLPHGNVTASRSILSSGPLPSRVIFDKRRDVASTQDDIETTVSQSGPTGGSESLLPNGSAEVQILMYSSEEGDDMVIDVPPVQDASPRPSEPTIVPPDLGNVSLSGPTPTIVIERPTPPAYVVAATHDDKNASSASQVDAEAPLLAPPPPPPKRGRGRPRKMQTLVALPDESVEPGSAEDSETPLLSLPPLKRGRGRPRKTDILAAVNYDDAVPNVTGDCASDVAEEQQFPLAPAPTKRGRGRPRKTDTLVSAHKDDLAQNAAEKQFELPSPQPPKRGRGRPRKTEVLVTADGDGAAPDVAQGQLQEQYPSPATAPAKRGRGRPRKIVPPVSSTAALQVEPLGSDSHNDGSFMSDNFATAPDIPVEVQDDHEAASAPPGAHFATSFDPSEPRRGEPSRSEQTASQFAVFDSAEDDSGAQRRSMRIREALTSESGTKMQKLRASLAHLRPKRRKLKHDTDQSFHIDAAAQNHAIHDLLDESHIFTRTWMSLLNIPSSNALDRVSFPSAIPTSSLAASSSAVTQSRESVTSLGIPIPQPDRIQDAHEHPPTLLPSLTNAPDSHGGFVVWGDQAQPEAVASQSSSSRFSAVEGPSVDDVPLPFNDPEYNMWMNAMSGPPLAFGSQQEIAANHDMYAMQGVQWSNDVPAFIPANSSYASSSSVS